MARRTILVSDLTGEEIDDKSAARIVITFGDARKGTVAVAARGLAQHVRESGSGGGQARSHGAVAQPKLRRGREEESPTRRESRRSSWGGGGSAGGRW